MRYGGVAQDWHVRRGTAEALGAIGDTAAVPHLTALLTAEDAAGTTELSMAHVAAQALEQIGTPEARAAVERWQRGAAPSY